MNINFSWGFYVANHLTKFDASLTTDVSYYSALKSALKVNKLKNNSLIRIGDPNKDGGYIMVEGIYNSHGVAYSFGICDDVTWDNSMANLGYHIYMYDHTIVNLPDNRPEFIYFREGIAGSKIPSQPLDSLEHYIQRNKHENTQSMILKMDVEGAEWDFLDTVSFDTLKQFDQILFEFHNLVRADNSDRLKKRIQLLNKLNTTHHLVHLHGNNTGYLLTVGDTCFPDVLEATYVLKDKYDTCEDNNLYLPIDIDCPNDINRPDVQLGFWNKPLVVDLNIGN